MNAFTVTKHGHSRFWAVRDPAGELVCLCVYRRGAVEVIRRLTCGGPAEAFCLRDEPPAISQQPVRALPNAANPVEPLPLSPVVDRTESRIP